MRSIVRKARGEPRPSAAIRVKYQSATFAPPTLGWVANADPTSPPRGGAAMLDNWFPTATGAVLRRGLANHALLLDPIRSFLTFVSGSTSKLFTATDNVIYDTTAPSSLDVLTDDLADVIVTDDGDNFLFFGETPSVEVDSLTGGDWISTQFSNSDGDVYLVCVNGADEALKYDGTTWDTAPDITFPPGVGLTSADLSYVWSHKNRLFFVERESTNTWYLAPYAIGGELKKLPLGASFRRGGKLLFGFTWSTDTGSGGLSEQCVFISTEGEAAIFQGTDPDSASTWSKVGTYRIGSPMGPRAHFPGGGDVAIGSDIGLVPLSQALQKDFSVLSANAASAKIETEWNKAVSTHPAKTWSCTVWSAAQMVVVLPAATDGLDPEVFVSNARTGAWARYTAWGGNCMVVHDDRLFFGTEDGRVVEANVTGKDIEEPYTGVYVPLFSSMETGGVKTTAMTRATLRSAIKPNDKVSMLRDYKISLPSVPATTVATDPNAWGVGVWGTMEWGVPLESNLHQVWRSTPQVGYVVSPALMVTSGEVVPLDIEIVQIDVSYTSSDVVA